MSFNLYFIKILILVILGCDMLILKTKNKIILIFFQIKNILKNKYYHLIKQPSKHTESSTGSSSPSERKIENFAMVCHVTTNTRDQIKLFHKEWTLKSITTLTYAKTNGFYYGNKLYKFKIKQRT
jgi:hypothetical protein